jgi:hypothetical protein
MLEKFLQKMNLKLWLSCRNFLHYFTKLTSNVWPRKYTAHRFFKTSSVFYLFFARGRVKKRVIITRVIITRVSTVNITLVKGRAKGAHTRTSLARESASGRLTREPGWLNIFVFSNSFWFRLNVVPAAAVVPWRRLNVFGNCICMV